MDPAADRADDLEALANAVMETQPRARPEKPDKEPVGQGVEVGRAATCECCARSSRRTDRLAGRQTQSGPASLRAGSAFAQRKGASCGG